MRENRHITAFYLETVILVLVFVAVILILTQVFGLSLLRDNAAGRLNDAVSLAQNAAEAVSASENKNDLLALLDENGSAVLSGKGVVARYDEVLLPAAEGEYLVNVSWEPDAEGNLVSSVIEVFRGNDEEPLYRLNTAVFLRGVSP